MYDVLKILVVCFETGKKLPFGLASKSTCERHSWDNLGHKQFSDK